MFHNAPYVVIFSAGGIFFLIYNSFIGMIYQTLGSLLEKAEMRLMLYLFDNIFCF